MAAGPVAHFCQGYEGHLEHLAPQLPAIESIYRRRLPKLVVSPHLQRWLDESFGQPSRVTPPILDPLFRPRIRFAPRRNSWVAVPGVFEAEIKRVARALEAVRILRGAGLTCRTLRFSSFPLSRREADLLTSDRYLCDAPPARIADELRRCDLLFLPSRADEGFGLPALEAMASGVPVVAAALPSVAFMADGAITTVEDGNPEDLATEARRLLTRPPLWRAARRRGLARARRFSVERVLPDLEAAIEWAANGVEATG